MVKFMLCIFLPSPPNITGEPYFADPEFRAIKSSRKRVGVGQREGGRRKLYEYNTVTLLISSKIVGQISQVFKRDTLVGVGWYSSGKQQFILMTSSHGL